MMMSSSAVHGCASSASEPSAAKPPRDERRYELRYTDLFDTSRGYAFPCDAQGHVDMEELSDRGLVNYLFARALVGRQLSIPTISQVA